MARNQYTLRMNNCNGTYIKDITSIQSLQFGRKKNDVGFLTLVVSGNDYDFSEFDEDYQLEVYRNVNGKNILQGDTCFFIETVELEVNGQCEEVITITCVDTIGLIQRRIVAFSQVLNSNYASKILEFYDNIIHLLAIYNFGAGTSDLNEANTITGYTPAGVFATTPALQSWNFAPYGSSVAALLNREFPIIITNPPTRSTLSGEFEFSGVNLLEAMQDVANASILRGENLWFDIDYTPAFGVSPQVFTFRTWVGVRGTDRSSGSNLVLVGPEFGNVNAVTITKDWSDYANVAYVNGQGDVDLKSWAGVRSTESSCKFGDREIFESSNVGQGNAIHQTEDLISEGRILLAEHRPQFTMQGRIINGQPYTFGENINYGDLLIAKYKTTELVVEISEYEISVDTGGEEINVPFSTV